jgi:predicted O-linked N-acetylglucosamine transferase (SPINDLY family)
MSKRRMPRKGPPKVNPVGKAAVDKQRLDALQKMLNTAVGILRSTGASDAIAHIDANAVTLAASKVPRVDALLLLVRSAMNSDPKVALDVCTYMQTLDNPSVEAMVIAGSLQDRLGDRVACEATMRAVIAAEAAQPAQRLRAANLLVRFGEQELALTAARDAYQAMGEPIEHAATLLYIAQVTADWPLVAQLTAQLRAGYAGGEIGKINESPRTHLLWCGDEALNLQVLQLWSKSNLRDPLRPAPKALAPQGRRLRVGYLSSDFREHPTSRLILGVLRHHDRAQVELFMYCSGWDDGSRLRKDVEAQFDHIHSVATLSDESAAELMRSHQIDVLVELNGPTRAHRMGILRHRPAAVQIDYLGWPGSVGGRVADYIIGDDHTVPDGAETLYPEKVIRLHPTYQANDHASFTPAPKPSRKDVGLPEDPTVQVLGMFNAVNKVHQEVWDTWMQIMRAAPKSVLWMLDPGTVARKAIAKAAQKAGVPLSRILASPKLSQDGHLARIQCCDLMLDPWPYGGHTSTADALFSGVPVLAMEGQNFAGRVSPGLLHAAGMGTLVCATPQAYVDRAVALLRNPRELAALQQRLVNERAKSPVFDTASRAGQLEKAFRVAVDRAAKGLAPVHIRMRPPAPQRPAGPAGRAPLSAALAQIAATDIARPPLTLVCGPWSSGTSAVAGMLAHAGLQAPGPYVTVNDPRTKDTYEMKAFQTVLRSLASEETLKRTTDAATALQRLRDFRDQVIAPAIGHGADAPRLMLKHGLAALFLDELSALFDLQIVGVLRPLAAIEKTRQRRGWLPSFGEKGADVIYRTMFDHVVNRATPFQLLRYDALINEPAAAFENLAAFCGLQAVDDAAKTAALGFVTRRS